MEQNKLNLDSRIDYSIILPVFVLSIIGLLSLFVALSQDPALTSAQVTTGIFKQVLWYILGAVSIVAVMQLNSKMLWKITPFCYLGGLAMMVLLLNFYNQELYELTGAKNWVQIGGTTFQPSELMKIAFIMMLAYVVTKHNARHSQRTIETDLWLLGSMIVITIPVAVLMLLQKDFGTLLVFIAILGGVFLMSGISWKIVAPTIIIFFSLAALVIFMVTTETGRAILYKIGAKSYQFARIDTWLDPFHDTNKSTYQVANGLMAIGSGGIFGKGFNQSEVYVPVRESDMIFTVIGENFGFIGSCFVIFLYFILIYQMIRVCFDTNNEFYAYIATGNIMMILFHVFENIGANIGLLPLTGIPLPFISQGGSALLGNMLGVGLIMSMRFQTESRNYVHK